MKKPFYLIAGLGKTGRSVAGFLQRKQQAFAFYDTRQEPAGLAELQRDFPQASVFLEHFPEDNFSMITSIIASPGLPLDTPLFSQARGRNIPIIGDIECLAREVRQPLIAITGTNGKSTVTTLVGEMAKAEGLSVAVAGNIGLPVLDLLDDGNYYDLWVLELSSFQLDLTHSLAPIAATVLNISEDHLDRHGSLAAYVTAKQRIYQQASICIYNRADKATFPQIGTQQHSFGLDAADESNWGLVEAQRRLYLAKGKEPLIAVEDIGLKGQQNWENALAACALAETVAISQRSMIQVLKNFAGLAHRCQWVRTLKGVDWINDSKGTNTGAAIAAITGIGNSIAGKIILIAGGLGKGADFTELQPAVAAHVRALVLIGTDAPLIAQALDTIVPTIHAQTLEEAVLVAQQQAADGDVVLLSPACASLDMFRDFNHRGEAFTQLVQSL